MLNVNALTFAIIFTIIKHIKSYGNKKKKQTLLTIFLRVSNTFTEKKNPVYSLHSKHETRNKQKNPKKSKIIPYIK